MLFRLEDCIFEGLPKALAMEWPVRFTIALRDSGADEEALRRACMRFLHTTVSRALERYADAETSTPMSADEERDAALAVRAARAARAETAWVETAAADAAERAVQAVAVAVTLVEWAAAAAAAVAAVERMGAAVERMGAAVEAAYTEMADTLIAEIEAAS